MNPGIGTETPRQLANRWIAVKFRNGPSGETALVTTPWRLRVYFGPFGGDRIRPPKQPWIKWDREKTVTPALDPKQRLRVWPKVRHLLAGPRLFRSSSGQAQRAMANCLLGRRTLSEWPAGALKRRRRAFHRVLLQIWSIRMASLRRCIQTGWVLCEGGAIQADCGKQTLAAPARVN